MNEFVDYVMSFYGKGEIYDINAQEEEVLVAIGIRLERFKFIPFEEDSSDREKIRDIILEMRSA